jgi:hypothetical protein
MPPANREVGNGEPESPPPSGDGRLLGGPLPSHPGRGEAEQHEAADVDLVVVLLP